MANLYIFKVIFLTVGLLGAALAAPKGGNQQQNNEKPVKAPVGQPQDDNSNNNNHPAGKNECAGNSRYMDPCMWSTDGTDQVKGLCDYRYDKLGNSGHMECKAWCGVPQDVQLASIEGLSEMTPSSYFEGAIISYTCDANYVAEGNTDIYCLSTGYWTEANFECLIDCGEPDATALYGDQSFVDVKSDNNLADAIASFDCNSGWEAVGVLAAQCTDNNGVGTWETSDGECVQLCPGTLPTVNNADAPSVFNTWDNAVVVYTCQSGYVYQNGIPVTATCLDGVWTSSSACIKDCGTSFPEVQNGSPQPTCDTTLGSSVTYNCDYDDETRTSTCTESGWTTPVACPDEAPVVFPADAPADAPADGPADGPANPPQEPECACPASAIGAHEAEVSSNGDGCTLGNTVTVRCKAGAVSTTGGTTVVKTCGANGWEATSDLGCWSVESECTSDRVREMTGRSNDNKGYLYDSCCIYPMENDVNLWDYNGQGGNADALSYCAGSASGYTGSVAVPDDIADWRVYKNIADNELQSDQIWVGHVYRNNQWESILTNAAAPFLHQPVSNEITLADGVCSAFTASSSNWYTTSCSRPRDNHKALCKVCPNA